MSYPLAAGRRWRSDSAYPLFQSHRPPPISFAPNLCVAVIAGTAYEITGTLLAPVLPHALYNGTIACAAFRALRRALIELCRGMWFDWVRDQ